MKCPECGHDLITEKQWEALRLVRCEGKTLREAGDVLGITPKNVYFRLKRLFKKYPLLELIVFPRFNWEKAVRFYE